MPTSAATPQVAARAVPASAPAQTAAPQHETSLPNTPKAAQVAAPPAVQPKVEDVEERKGPFTIKGQTFSVVQHLKVQNGEPDATLALLEIVDSEGIVRYRDDFPYLEGGGFCPAGVKVISGSNGAGFLLDMACSAGQPDSGGPWQILSVANGKISPLGKPFSASGEIVDFVPGEIKKIGNLTQIHPDELKIRLFTGYFYVTVVLRVGWWEGGLALAQHCFSQTGHGFAPDGCEMPADDVGHLQRDQELTFLRMFSESNAQGIPEHVVVKKDSQVEVLAGKVFVTFEESKTGIDLGVGPDMWFKVRIDGKVGWIHTEEDLQAIGLYQR
ncbi:MAG TPA: hypothetical protein VFN26_06375 [Candidatus Acidoferrum sp.]|nr:hypothetical protein [Candidatus Acidoferrum sp.]